MSLLLENLSSPTPPKTSKNYSRFTDGTLRSVTRNEEVTPLTHFVHDSFRSLVLNQQFTCVAAKSAFNKNNYRFSTYEAALTSDEATDALAADLTAFVAEQDATLRETGYSTFVATFDGPTVANEETFERLLWEQLQKLHDRHGDQYSWDETVSTDPEDPTFEFSFAGRAFFVVGMHPASSRFTRRFAWNTLVFNAHFQFEELRASGKFGRMQTAIRSRDTNLQGSINPNLTDFGERSDARQYSGRAVEESWRCPFHAHIRKEDENK